MNGANQSGTQITITATAGDTFAAGDKISFTGVNRVNPMTAGTTARLSRRRSPSLRALLPAGGGAHVINILPAIYGPGSRYQNVDPLHANGAALTLFPGTTSPNGKAGTVGLALSRYGFALVGAKLYVPKAVESAGQATDPDTGMSVRKVKARDPVRSMEINRMDSLGGFGALYQYNGVVTPAIYRCNHMKVNKLNWRKLVGVELSSSFWRS
jgi:hypothetical protein